MALTSTWDQYPADYRADETARLLRATRAGDCAALIGLSGSGKSNVLGFMAARLSTPAHRLCLVDGNALAAPTREALLELIRSRLDPSAADAASAVAAALVAHPHLTLLIDRLDSVSANGTAATLHNTLRALRDTHKFMLTYIIATRHPLPVDSELAELLFANTVFLGPLSAGDAQWNVERFAARRDETWPAAVVSAIITFSRGYPSLLKAACEAHATGLPEAAWADSPAVKRRVDEFWSDTPSDAQIAASGLAGHPLLDRERAVVFDTTKLTAKENLLLQYLQAHPDEVCEKDELIRAVWSEDKAFVKGIRDDSLAQLVRRLREKIEPDPSDPKFLIAVPGRGYRFTKG
jgi:Transcriptional regulatory protein, C terminal